MVRVWGPEALAIADARVPARAGPSAGRDAARAGRGSAGSGRGWGTRSWRSSIGGEPPEVEIHCHGGPAPVALVVEALVAAGAERRQPSAWVRHDARSTVAAEALVDLARAPTLADGRDPARTGPGGPRARAGRRSAGWSRPTGRRRSTAVERLLARADVGRQADRRAGGRAGGAAERRQEPALNALAGFDRAIVDPTPGHDPRRGDGPDGVRRLARRAGRHGRASATPTTPIEAAGIALARARHAEADLIVLRPRPLRAADRRRPLVLDAAASRAAWSSPTSPTCRRPGSRTTGSSDRLGRARATGSNGSSAAVARRLVPDPPAAGRGRPVPAVARRDGWKQALDALRAGDAGRGGPAARRDRRIAGCVGSVQGRTGGRVGDAVEVGAGGAGGAVLAEPDVVAAEGPGGAVGGQLAAELQVAVDGHLLAGADGDGPVGPVVEGRHGADLVGLVAAVGGDLVVADPVPFPDDPVAHRLGGVLAVDPDQRGVLRAWREDRVAGVDVGDGQLGLAAACSRGGRGRRPSAAVTWRRVRLRRSAAWPRGTPWAWTRLPPVDATALSISRTSRRPGADVDEVAPGAEEAVVDPDGRRPTTRRRSSPRRRRRRPPRPRRRPRRPGPPRRSPCSWSGSGRSPARRRRPPSAPAAGRSRAGRTTSNPSSWSEPGAQLDHRGPGVRPPSGRPGAGRNRSLGRVGPGSAWIRHDPVARTVAAGSSQSASAATRSSRPCAPGSARALSNWSAVRRTAVGRARGAGGPATAGAGSAAAGGRRRGSGRGVGSFSRSASPRRGHHGASRAGRRRRRSAAGSAGPVVGDGVGAGGSASGRSRPAGGVGSRRPVAARVRRDAGRPGSSGFGPSRSSASSVGRRRPGRTGLAGPRRRPRRGGRRRGGTRGSGSGASWARTCAGSGSSQTDCGSKTEPVSRTAVGRLLPAERVADGLAAGRGVGRRAGRCRPGRRGCPGPARRARRAGRWRPASPRPRRRRRRPSRRPGRGASVPSNRKTGPSPARTLTCRSRRSAATGAAAPAVVEPDGRARRPRTCSRGASTSAGPEARTPTWPASKWQRSRVTAGGRSPPRGRRGRADLDRRDPRRGRVLPLAGDDPGAAEDAAADGQLGVLGADRRRAARRGRPVRAGTPGRRA